MMRQASMTYFRALMMVAMLCAMIAVAAAEQKPLLNARSTAELKKAFSAPGTVWNMNARGIVGKSPHYYELPGTALDGFVDDNHTYFVAHAVNLWRYAFAGKREWNNYRFETTVKILDPAPLKGPRPGGGWVFMNYQWGREAVGSDAGLIVRYTDQNHYYMVRLSSGYGHVELWKTRGGVVCVKPFVFKPQQGYRVAVTAAGRWIVVAIDGQEVLRYYDPIEPLMQGQVGVGVRESQVQFGDVLVTPVAPITDPAPKHVANFHLRPWVGRQYLFDGDEPIAWIDPHNVAAVQEVKLVPGMMPMTLIMPGATWGDLNWKPEMPFTVEQEGETFAFSAVQEDKDGRCSGTGRCTLTYDPKVGYVWDNYATVTALVDDKMKQWDLNIIDPYYYQTVANATSKMPTCRTHPNYCLYMRTDGKYGYFPTNHQFKNNLDAGVRDLAIIRGGFVATTVDDYAVVTEMPDDNVYDYALDYCHWGLDQHVYPIIDPTKAQGNVSVRAKKGDVYQGHARIYAFTPAKVQEILRQAVLPAGNIRAAQRELIAHEEPVNHFGDIVTAVAGDSKFRWTGGYTIDRTVGRGDKISMRIDPAQMKGAPMPGLWVIGPSFRTGPYTGLQYRIGVWLKADAFTGKVTLVADGFNVASGQKIAPLTAELPINGRCDWTFISFQSNFPRLCHNSNIYLKVEGQGVVWADDFEISPIK